MTGTVLFFWKPVGIIAECAGGIPELSRRTIGRIPIVYLGMSFFENPSSSRLAFSGPKRVHAYEFSTDEKGNSLNYPKNRS